MTLLVTSCRRADEVERLLLREEGLESVQEGGEKRPESDQ